MYPQYTMIGTNIIQPITEEREHYLHAFTKCTMFCTKHPNNSPYNQKIE